MKIGSILKYKCEKCKHSFAEEQSLKAHYLMVHFTLMPTCSTSASYQQIEKIEQMRLRYKQIRKVVMNMNSRYKRTHGVSMDHIKNKYSCFRTLPLGASKERIDKALDLFFVILGKYYVDGGVHAARIIDIRKQITKYMYLSFEMGRIENEANEMGVLLLV